MIKGTTKLTRHLNKWLKEHHFDGCKVSFDSDFAYEYDKDKIYYSLIVPEDSVEAYKKYCELNGLMFECDDFVLSFFHELGHRETYDELDGDEVTLSTEIAEEFNSLPIEHTLTEDDYFKYFNSPAEYKATIWAITYINSYPTTVEYFWKDVQKMIKNIYAKNGLEEQ